MRSHCPAASGDSAQLGQESPECASFAIAASLAGVSKRSRMAAQAQPATSSSSEPPLTSVFSERLFRGQCALVTGGGTGIGFAIARLLFHLGASVMIAARRESILEAACASLEAERTAASGRIGFTTVDIRSSDAVDAMVEEAVSRFGQIRLLVQNSGGQFVSDAASMSVRGFDSVVQLNLVSTFRVARAVFDACMSDGRGGAMVAMSLDVDNGMPGMAHSAAARAGINNLVKTLSIEWASSGVRVNAVAPGIIYSESAFSHYGDAAEDLLSALLPAIPAKRLGTPEEVAGVVAFLLSPAAAYVTGSILAIGGGSHLVRKPLLPMDEPCALQPYGPLPRRARL